MIAHSLPFQSNLPQSFAANQAANAVTVKKTDGTIVQPTLTVMRDTFDLTPTPNHSGVYGKPIALGTEFKTLWLETVEYTTIMPNTQIVEQTTEDGTFRHYENAPGITTITTTRWGQKHAAEQLATAGTGPAKMIDGGQHLGQSIAVSQTGQTDYEQTTFRAKVIHSRMETVFENGEWNTRVAEKVVAEYEGTDPARWNGSEWVVIKLPPMHSEAEAAPESSSIPTSSGSISFATLGALLGLEGSSFTKSSLLDSLDKLIDRESKALETTLGSVLGKLGLGGVTKKITFGEDKDGNIIVEGNIRARDKKRIAQLINDDPELVERIKTQKARMEIAAELAKDDADLSDKKFDAARTQLLKNVLAEHGTSLEEYDAAKKSFNMTGQVDEKFSNLHNLLNILPELNSELAAYEERRAATPPPVIEAPGEADIQRKSGGKNESENVRSLLAIKRGVVSEATDEEPNFAMDIMELRTGVFRHIVDVYNEFYDGDPSMKITDFNMKIDDRGRLSFIDVQTAGDDPEANLRAAAAMNTWFSSAHPSNPGALDENGEVIERVAAIIALREAAEELGLAMLDAHDDEHGDVQEYRHEIIIGAMSGVAILSPDADAAALAELAVLTEEVGGALGRFFGEMGIENPFSLLFGSDGLLSFEGGELSYVESQAVKKMLESVNDYITAEASGEDTTGMLSVELTGIAEKLIGMKEVIDKIHDKSLLPKEGLRFAF